MCGWTANGIFARVPIRPNRAKGIFGHGTPSRNVAIRSAGPQIGFDIVAIGVPADAACTGHLRSAFRASGGLKHAFCHHSLFSTRLRPAQQPDSGRGGCSGRSRNQPNSCCAWCASATLVCTKSSKTSATQGGERCPVVPPAPNCHPTDARNVSPRCDTRERSHEHDIARMDPRSVLERDDFVRGATVEIHLPVGRIDVGEGRTRSPLTAPS
jgi:hypothetical protein